MLWLVSSGDSIMVRPNTVEKQICDCFRRSTRNRTTPENLEKKTFQTKALLVRERVNDKNDKLIQLKYSTIDSIIIHFFQAHNCSHIRGSILSHEQTVCIIWEGHSRNMNKNLYSRCNCSEDSHRSTTCFSNSFVSFVQSLRNIVD